MVSRSGDARSDRCYSLGLTRHDQLNRAFGGGLPKGALVWVEGDYRAGKSVLAGRFAHGLCERGHDVTFLSTERPVSEFIDWMESLSYEVTPALLDRDLRYLHADLASSGASDAPRILDRLTSTRHMWNADVAILDAFGDLLRHDPTFEEWVERRDREQAARRLVAFFRRLVAGDRTVVLTADPTRLREQTLLPFRAAADVLLELTRTPGPRRAGHTIRVGRFVGTGRRIPDSITFLVRPKVGLVVEHRRVI